MYNIFKSNKIEESPTIKQQFIDIFNNKHKLKREIVSITDVRTAWIDKYKKDDVIIIENIYYKLCSKLGEGSYGIVWKVCDSATNYYALKLNKSNDIAGEQLHLQLSNIQSILTGISINQIEIPNTQININCFLMELGQPTKIATFNECFYIINNIYTNLVDMYKYNLCHNDIKPDNIVRRNNSTYSLIDFSLCGYNNENVDSYVIQTRWYKSRELLVNYHTQNQLKSDLWALGCTIVELYSNNVLFMGENEKHQLQLVDTFIDLSLNDKFNYVYNKTFNKNMPEDDILYKNKKMLIDLIIILLLDDGKEPNINNLLQIINECISTLE